MAQMRIGVVSSGGAATLSYAFSILRAHAADVEFKLITDRPCPAEDLARCEGFAWRRVAHSNAKHFSQDASDILIGEWNVDGVCLLFSRLVTAELFDSIRTVNLHPSLLPAFSGLQPELRSYRSEPKLVGATSHLVDSGIDSGPIIAQSASEHNSSVDYSLFCSRLLVHKVLQFLSACEYIRGDGTEQGGSTGLLATEITGPIILNPSLTDETLLDRFVQIIDSEIGEAKLS